MTVRSDVGIGSGCSLSSPICTSYCHYFWWVLTRGFRIVVAVLFFSGWLSTKDEGKRRDFSFRMKVFFFSLKIILRGVACFSCFQTIMSYRTKLISIKNLYSSIQLFKFKFGHSDWLYLLKYFANFINFMIKIKI